MAGPDALRISSHLAARAIRARLVSPWLYVLASGVCGLVALAATAFHKTFETESVAVDASPLASANGAVLGFLALALGAQAATSLSWEREHRTMEVLFAGPVSAGALLGGKVMVEGATLFLLLLVYSAYCLAVRPVGGGLEAGQVAEFWAKSLLVLPSIGLGLLLSAQMGTVRGAILSFLAAFTLLGALEAAHLWLSAKDPNDLTLAVLYVRRAVAAATDLLAPVSPVAYLLDALRPAPGTSALDPGRLAGGVALFLAEAAGAAAITRARGAL
jgi:hypothetical protein